MMYFKRKTAICRVLLLGLKNLHPVQAQAQAYRPAWRQMLTKRVARHAIDFTHTIRGEQLVNVMLKYMGVDMEGDFFSYGQGDCRVTLLLREPLQYT